MRYLGTFGGVLFVFFLVRAIAFSPMADFNLKTILDQHGSILHHQNGRISHEANALGEQLYFVSNSFNVNSTCSGTPSISSSYATGMCYYDTGYEAFVIIGAYPAIDQTITLNVTIYFDSKCKSLYKSASTKLPTTCIRGSQSSTLYSVSSYVPTFPATGWVQRLLLSCDYKKRKYLHLKC